MAAKTAPVKSLICTEFVINCMCLVCLFAGKQDHIGQTGIISCLAFNPSNSKLYAAGSYSRSGMYTMLFPGAGGTTLGVCGWSMCVHHHVLLAQREGINLGCVWVIYSRSGMYTML